MADPIIPGGIRAQAVFDGPSGLPEDRYVNTFAFSSTGSYAAASDEVAARIEDFYVTPGGLNTNVLASFLSPGVAAVGRIFTYDLGETPPRVPTEHVLDLSGVTGGTTPMPSEVALCGSFYASRNLPRSRGRVYIGPLGTNALDVSDDTAIPATGLINSLVGACERLAAPGSVTWCVLSQADQELKTVTGGWVDNAFDTQRRRGEAPTTRTPWVLT